MYFKYLKIRLLSAYRTICELNIRQQFVLFFLVLFVVAVCIAKVQAYYLSALQGLMLYFCHVYRRDKSFIRLFFGEKCLLVYWLEYTILSFPLVVLSACKGYYPDLLIHILIVLLTPLLFRFKIKKFHFDHPFLIKGSYEYQTSFRTNYGILLLCYILAFMGLYKENESLTCVFYVLVGLPFIDSLLREEPLLYTANFLCVKDLCELKFKNICYNSLILYVPLLLICTIMNIHLLGKLSFITLLIILLTYISLLLKYALKNYLLSGFLVVCVLIPIFIFSLTYPYVSLLFPLIMVFLLMQTNNRLKYLFCYDTNR